MLTPISIVACLVHSDKLQIARIAKLMTACIYAASMVLTGNSMGMAVKFGINTTSVVLEIYYFQYNTRGIYPKFHCYPCCY